MADKVKTPKKVKGRPGRKPTLEGKLLKEISVTNGLLRDIKEILDNTWRQRMPQ